MSQIFLHCSHFVFNLENLMKNNIHLAFFDVIAAFTLKVNFYFLVSSFRIKVLLIASFNLKREIVFVSSTGTIILLWAQWWAHMVAVILCCLKRSRIPTWWKFNVLIVETSLVLDISPDTGMEMGFGYKMATGIRQNMLLSMFSGYRKCKHCFKMLVKDSGIPKNTSENDPKTPF